MPPRAPQEQLTAGAPGQHERERARGRAVTRAGQADTAKTASPTAAAASASPTRSRSRRRRGELRDHRDDEEVENAVFAAPMPAAAARAIRPTENVSTPDERAGERRDLRHRHIRDARVGASLRGSARDRRRRAATPGAGGHARGAVAARAVEAAGRVPGRGGRGAAS